MRQEWREAKNGCAINVKAPPGLEVSPVGKLDALPEWEVRPIMTTGGT